MQIKQLKIKICSLAAEAVIIRREELKIKSKPTGHRDYDLFWSLRLHRTLDVRNEARAAQLAYAFLRNRTYYATECGSGHKTEAVPGGIARRALEIIMKFGDFEKRDAKMAETLFASWLCGQQLPHLKNVA